MPYDWKTFKRERVIVDHADVLRAMYEEVSSTIDAQSVVSNMFQANALTLKELQSIQSKHSKPVKAAQELLNIVMDQSGNVYSCFLDALKKTGHQRVYKIIVSGSCKGVYMNNTHHREPNVECNIFAKLQISLNVYEFQ